MSSQEHQIQEIKVKKLYEKRQYGCPCGKFYLSYPALFTHVKQKHGGKPPGNVIKPPKNANIKRGRPPIQLNVHKYQNKSHSINLEDYFNKLLRHPIKLGINHIELDKNQQGTSNCFQIFAKFINKFATQQSKKNVLICFVSLMKDHLTKVRGQNYCQNHNAQEIIDISNQIVTQFDDYRQKYPFPRNMLIDLFWGFFNWLYEERLTDHRLQRRQNFLDQQQK